MVGLGRAHQLDEPVGSAQHARADGTRGLEGVCVRHVRQRDARHAEAARLLGEQLPTPPRGQPDDLQPVGQRRDHVECRLSDGAGRTQNHYAVLHGGAI